MELVAEPPTLPGRRRAGAGVSCCRMDDVVVVLMVVWGWLLLFLVLVLLGSLARKNATPLKTREIPILGGKIVYLSAPLDDRSGWFLISGIPLFYTQPEESYLFEGRN